MTEIHQYVRNNNWFLNLRFASISRIPFVDSRSLFFAFGVCVYMYMYISEKHKTNSHEAVAHSRVGKTKEIV